MRAILSLEGRRLLELAKARRAELAGGPLAEAWDIVVEALARGWLMADGPDSIPALLAELDSGGGLRVEELAIEVSFDDPRGETLVISFGGEQLLASRSALVRELRGLWRGFRGEEAPRAAESEAAAEPAVEEAGPGDGAFAERVASARVELKDALGKIGALLKERISAAAAKTDVDVGAAASATKERVEGAAVAVRERIESVLATLRDAAARAQAEEDAKPPSRADSAEAEAEAVGAEASGAERAEVSGAERAAASEPAEPRARDPRAMLAELRRQLGAGQGQGEGRQKLADAVRRLGAHVPEGGSEAAAKVADTVRRFADWVGSPEGGGAAVENLLAKLGDAFDEAQKDGDDSDDDASAADDAAGPAGATRAKRKRHLRLVPDDPGKAAAAPDPKDRDN